MAGISVTAQAVVTSVVKTEFVTELVTAQTAEVPRLGALAPIDSVKFHANVGSFRIGEVVTVTVEQ